MKLRHYEDWGINSVSINPTKRSTLLRYWTTRYLLILFIGLVLIGLISTLWIRQITVNNQIDAIAILAEDVAEQIATTNLIRPMNQHIRQFVDQRLLRMKLGHTVPFFVTNLEDQLIFSNESNPQRVINSDLLTNPSEITSKFTMRNGERALLISRPIIVNDVVYGWVHFANPQTELFRLNKESMLLLTMLGTFAAIGWATIYFLTSRLAKPIKQVSDAALQIREGNYTLQLPTDLKEQELYTLVESFHDMSDRLQQLEQLRTELLAGVTHELKTPVTSISSLLQAVQDGVVTGKETEEYIEFSLKEANRLKNMVADLLDYNAFVTGAVRIRAEEVQLNSLLSEITHQWKLVHDDSDVRIHSDIPIEHIWAKIDPLRVQQIIDNLLNNAYQAIEAARKTNSFTTHGDIRVSLKHSVNEHIMITISDNGPGIPESEQSLIFERFFRGENKKHHIRGLGLGLSFCRMAARAMNGELILQESSPKGSTFVLTLAKRPE